MVKMLIFIAILTPSLVLAQSKPITELTDNAPTPTPLCNVDGIQSEIMKAINLLKKKELETPKHVQLVKPFNPIPTTRDPNMLRQEDDDDDIPYYVPAIAKVVGSVLAQNATNIIEESFGFIPPEVNKNIRYVLGLVSETIEKLRPMMNKPNPPTSAVSAAPVAASPEGQTASISAGQISEIEELLAFAIGQQLGEKIGGSNSNTGPASATQATQAVEVDSSTVETQTPLAPASEIANSDVHSSIIGSGTEKTVAQPVDLQTVTNPLVPLPMPLEPENPSKDLQMGSQYSPSEPPTSLPEFFTTTVGPFGVKNVQSAGLALVPIPNEDTNEHLVYAPAYAPNYEVTTTKLPVYAPAFDHNVHKYLYPSITPSASKGQAESLGTDGDLRKKDPTTTNDPIFTGDAITTTTTEETVVTTEDDYEEGGVVDENTATAAPADSTGATNAPDASVTTEDYDEENEEDDEDDSKRRSLS